MTLPRLTNDDDWLDLHTDDHAVIIGDLEAYRRDFLMVRFPDWAVMSISIEQEDGANRPKVVLGTRIELEVIRTEDGLMTTEDNIRRMKLSA